GADIYCDTKTIARRLERERPSPTLFPEDLPAIARGLAFWGETLFMDLVVLGFGLGIFPEDFVEDRKKMVPGGVSAELAKMLVPSKIDEIRAKVELIDRQLSDRRPYLLGDRVCFADLCVYHPLWALRTVPGNEPLLAPLRHVPAWMDRIG